MAWAEAYAEKFARAGYVVVLFDYRHFGASAGEPRQLFNVRRQLADWASAIAYARALDDVDPNRIALWGTSFSGGHVIVAAAQDEKIAAVSAQCPMMDALAASINVIQYAGPGAFLKLGLFGMLDQIRSLLRLSPLYIPLIAPPGRVAAMSSPDSASGYGALVPSHWDNRICARYAVMVGAYRPVSHARRVRCPVLIQVCRKDSLAPPRAARATARQIGAHAQLAEYDCGHFELYLGAYFTSASDQQLDFFNRVLAGDSA
jgi:uncharacterized protein